MNGIYIDPNWCGPKLAENSSCHQMRVEYWTHIYIPIPLLLFQVADTHTFNVKAKVTVFAGDLIPVELRTGERLHFSHFIRIVLSWMI